MDTSATWHRLYRRIREVLPAFRVPVAYLLLSFLFHAIDVNILRVSLAPGDGAVHGVPSKIYNAELSLWNPYILSGISRLASQGFQSLYWPGILVMKLFPSGFGYNLNLLLHYALAGYFTYLFVGRLGPRPWSAFISGICFMFSGFMSAHKGHHMMMNAATWLPLVLYCAERFLADRRYLGWLLGSAAAFAMSFYADYLAVPMYIAMVTVPYVCFRSMQTSRRGWMVGMRNGLLTTSTVLGLGMILAAPYILPILESLPRVTREQITYAFFSSYSFQILGLPMLLFPFAFGTQSPGFYRVPYFGPWNLTEMAGYMGLFPLALAILAFTVGRKQSKQVWFWSVLATLAFLLVLGDQTPLHHVLYRLPVYNMFRAPARNWLEVHFAVAVLAGFGVDLIGSEVIPRERLRQRMRWLWIGMLTTAGAIALAFCGLRALVPFLDAGKAKGILPWDITPRFGVPQFVAFVHDCWSFSSPNIYMPFIVLILGGLGVWAAAFWLKSDTQRWGMIALVVAGDLFTFGHFHDSVYDGPHGLARPEKNSVYQWLLGHDPELSRYRILPFETGEADELFPNVNLPLHVGTVNGYGGILLKDYSKLLGLEASGTVERARELIETNGVLSMLGTRYLVTKDPALKSVIERAACKDYPTGEVLCNALAQVDGGVTPTYQKVLEAERGIAVYRNNKVLPKLRFAKGVRCVKDFATAEGIIRNGALFNPAETTVVEGGAELADPAIFRGGTVLGGDLDVPDSWKGTVSTDGAALLIRSESSYPGWTATVDGKSTSILKVNGVLQGIVIPSAGMHLVEFAFKPRAFLLGLLAMFTGLLGACIALGVRRHVGASRRRHQRLLDELGHGHGDEGRAGGRISDHPRFGPE